MSVPEENRRRIRELERRVDFLLRELRLEEKCAAGASDERVERLVREGRKIEAIKVWRESTGADLKEAKEAVEALERRLQ